MVDFLHGKKIDWKVKTVEDLFNIGNIVEKYTIDGPEKLPQIIIGAANVLRVIPA